MRLGRRLKTLRWFKRALAARDTYAATLAARVFRALMAIVAYFDFDAVNAYLQAPLRQPIFCLTPDGLRRPGKLTVTLERLGFYAVPGVECVMTDGTIMIFLYVDDIGVIYHARHTARANALKQVLASALEINELGPIDWFLGIKVIRNRSRRLLWLSQSNYIDKICKRFAVKLTCRKFGTPLPEHKLPLVTDANNPELIHPYSERVGSANWLAIQTRPDISKACSLLSEHLKAPTKEAMHCAGHLLQYLLQTKDVALQLGVDASLHLEPAELARAEGVPPTIPTPHTGVHVLQDMAFFSDASYADDSLTRRSSHGLVVSLLGGTVDWKAAKQTTVTKSTTESELLALSFAGSELIWWQRFVEHLSITLDQPPVLFCDNKQTLRFVTEPSARLDTKLRHVDTHRHRLRQEVQAHRIRTKWLKTADMVADGMTKLLGPQKHAVFVDQLHLRIPPA